MLHCINETGDEVRNIRESSTSGSDKRNLDRNQCEKGERRTELFLRRYNVLLLRACVNITLSDINCCRGHVISQHHS